MSWEFEGRYYHNWDEYQRARQRGEERRAAAQVGTLQRELQRRTEQLRETEREISQVRGDVRRLHELQERLADQTEQLRQGQRQLQQAQRQLQNDMEAGFAEVRDHFAEVEGNIEQIERQHQEHVQAVNNRFAQVQREMEAGLAEAETRRRETEQRLRQAISEVDAKVEHDRQERLKQATSQLDRAAAMLGLVGEQLRTLEGRAEALDLEGDLHHIREQLTTATRLHSQGDAATALAAAEAAYAAARHSVHESERREAKLRQGRQRLVDSTRQIAQTLEQDLVQRYFKREASVARQVAGRLSERADQGYRSYAKLQIELDRDQRALEKLNDDVFTMDSQATVVQEQFREREARIAKIVGVLTEVCGTMTKEPVLTYKDPENRKSTRVVQCSFTSGQVDLHVPLDANQPFQLEGFGHSSNKNCELVFRRVAAKLNDETLAVNAHHDEQARSAPQLRSRASQANHLEGMSNRLDRLREDIDRA